MSTDGARLLSLTIPGPVGGLEALLRLPAAPTGAAVFAHPHPLHGGTMHTKVVHRVARLLADRLNLAALRFNFRGVGASEGVHDEGQGEVDDILAAVDWVRGRYAGGPLVTGGFSFGSVAALRAASRRPPDVLLLVGLPIDRWSVGDLAEEIRVEAPVLWLHGEADEYGDAGRARQIAARRGWRLDVIPRADHFFTGRLDELEEVAMGALRSALEPAPDPR